MDMIGFVKFKSHARRNWRRIVLNGKTIGKIVHHYDGRDYYLIQMTKPYKSDMSLRGRFACMEDAIDAVELSLFGKVGTSEAVIKARKRMGGFLVK